MLWVITSSFSNIGMPFDRADSKYHNVIRSKLLIHSWNLSKICKIFYFQRILAKRDAAKTKGCCNVLSYNKNFWTKYNIIIFDCIIRSVGSRLVSKCFSVDRLWVITSLFFEYRNAFWQAWLKRSLLPSWLM